MERTVRSSEGACEDGLVRKGTIYSDGSSYKPNANGRVMVRCRAIIMIAIFLSWSLGSAAIGYNTISPGQISTFTSF
jgi:hypothetical protein